MFGVRSESFHIEKIRSNFSFEVCPRRRRVATAATREEEKTLFNEKAKEPSGLRPAFSWKAFKIDHVRQIARYGCDILCNLCNRCVEFF
jgi:hypothetical protein